MVLTIYLDTYPDNMEFIDNIDDYFGNSKLQDDEYTNAVLNRIECAEYYNEGTFRDRTGSLLRTNCLSTGTKALLLLGYHPDKIFWCDEIGSNAVHLLSKGNAFFTRRNLCLNPTAQLLYKNCIMSGEEFNYMISIGED